MTGREIYHVSKPQSNDSEMSFMNKLFSKLKLVLNCLKYTVSEIKTLRLW